MSSKPKIELFEGNNSKECTAFIRAIRETAWAEGRLRDPAWMADFASLYFSGKAMSWHGRLSLDVRQDWFKMEGALIDRWAPADEDDDSHIQPVPAAAPKPAGIGGSDYVVCGVLKLVPDDVSVAPSYVKSNTKTCVPTPASNDEVRTAARERARYNLTVRLRPKQGIQHLPSSLSSLIYASCSFSLHIHSTSISVRLHHITPPHQATRISEIFGLTEQSGRPVTSGSSVPPQPARFVEP